MTIGAKTDRLDCLKLAEFAAKDMLKPIAVPDETQEADRSLIRRRHQVVDRIRATKQRIRSLLLQFGVPEPESTWSSAGLKALDMLSLPDSARRVLDSHLRELRFLRSELQQMHDDLKQASVRPVHRNVVSHLRSVPGVGQVTAMTFALEVFDPQRFQRAEELVSYLGLAPMVRQSGEGKGQARLHPVGQKRLRSLLVEASWIWMRKDPEAMRIYRTLVARSGQAQKAICALARRLAVILWRLSVQQRPLLRGGGIEKGRRKSL